MYVEHAHELVVPVPIHVCIGWSRTSGVFLDHFFLCLFALLQGLSLDRGLLVQLNCLACELLELAYLCPRYEVISTGTQNTT